MQAVPREHVSRYGIVEGIEIEDRFMKVKGLVEKPNVEETPSNVSILGRYIVTPKIFEILENTKPGREMKYNLQMH